MRAVDALMECLKAEGVDVVFGMPGGANLSTSGAFSDGRRRHIAAPAIRSSTNNLPSAYCATTRTAVKGSPRRWSHSASG